MDAKNYLFTFLILLFLVHQFWCYRITVNGEWKWFHITICLYMWYTVKYLDGNSVNIQSVVNKEFFCSNACKNIFHLYCEKIPGDLAHYLSYVACLQWICSTCREVSVKCSERKFLEIFDDKCKDLFSEVTAKFDKLKSEFMAYTSDKHSEIVASTTDTHNNIQATYAGRKWKKNNPYWFWKIVWQTYF